MAVIVSVPWAPAVPRSPGFDQALLVMGRLSETWGALANPIGKLQLVLAVSEAVAVRLAVLVQQIWVPSASRR